MQVYLFLTKHPGIQTERLAHNERKGKGQTELANRHKLEKVNGLTISRQRSKQRGK